MRTRDRAERPVIVVINPRHGCPAVEAYHQFSGHLDTSLHAFDDPDDRRMVLLGRHEVDHMYAPSVIGEGRFENQCIRKIAASDGSNRLRRQEPATVIVVAEQFRKATFRIEAREAQPIDRAITSDESCRLAIANQRIIFNASHGAPMVKQAPARAVPSASCVACATFDVDGSDWISKKSLCFARMDDHSNLLRTITNN